jgi:Flp pilus assembly pilin Flp
MSHTVTHFMTEEDGVSAMEYVLLGLLAAIVCLLALLALKKNT